MQELRRIEHDILVTGRQRYHRNAKPHITSIDNPNRKSRDNAQLKQPYALNRFIRPGGGWVNDAGSCRSANRGGVVASNRSSNFGFRVALSPSVRSPEADIEKK